MKVNNATMTSVVMYASFLICASYNMSFSILENIHLSSAEASAAYQTVLLPKYYISSSTFNPFLIMAFLPLAIIRPSNCHTLMFTSNDYQLFSVYVLEHEYNSTLALLVQLSPFLL